MRSSLVWLPLMLLWIVVKVVAVPAVLVVLARWLLPDKWAAAVTGVALVYLIGAAVFAGAAVSGRVRSLARGSFSIRDDSGRWDR